MVNTEFNQHWEESGIFPFFNFSLWWTGGWLFYFLSVYTSRMSGIHYRKWNVIKFIFYLTIIFLRCFITKGRYASENTINEPNLEAAVEDEESKSQVEDKDLPKMENKAEWVSENQNRIVGGSLASPGQFPFIASLKNKYGSSYSAFCGGAAIASNYVITVAHCVAVSLK